MNLELNVVRFENEDVIATSCNVDLTNKDWFDYISDIEGSYANIWMFLYDEKTQTFKPIDDAKIKASYYFNDASKVKEGMWIHHSTEGDGEICTDPNHHGAKIPK